MKANTLARSLAVSLVGFTAATNCFAEGQVVNLTASSYLGLTNTSLSLATNQIVTILGFEADGLGNVSFKYADGTYFIIVTTNKTDGLSAKMGHQFTGLTNIVASIPGGLWASFHVTVSIYTPSSQTYIPANCVVIPSDATGPVQILLESSADLANWTSALPGTYGASSTNRFFRVRALANP